MLRASDAGMQTCGVCVTDSSKLKTHLSSNVLRVGKLRQRADASLPPVACLGHGYHAQLRQPKSSHWDAISKFRHFGDSSLSSASPVR